MIKSRLLAAVACVCMLVPVHGATSGILGTQIRGDLWGVEEGDNFGCKSQIPIAITVTNRSFGEVVRVRFEVELWLDGRTQNLLKDASVKNFDKLGFVAQIGLRLCFPFPRMDLAYGHDTWYAKSCEAV